MSEQRWAVLRGAARNGWLVAHPNDIIRHDGRLDCWAVRSRHDTWAEAMQEADRMARTVEVVLPRNPHRRANPVETARKRLDHSPSSGWYGPIYSEYATTYQLTAGMEITIPDDQLEDVALALLAHARRRA